MNDTYAQFVDRLFVKRNKGHDGLLHAAIGMAGEAGELLDMLKKHWVYGKPLDLENAIEEAGDFYWYAQAWCLVAEIPFPSRNLNKVLAFDDPVRNMLVYAAGATRASGMVVDRVALRWSLEREHYDRGIDGVVLAAIYEMDSFCQAAGFTREEALAANVAKLNKRYPQGYTDSAAIARADKEPA